MNNKCKRAYIAIITTIIILLSFSGFVNAEEIIQNKSQPYELSFSIKKMGEIFAEPSIIVRNGQYNAITVTEPENEGYMLGAEAEKLNDGSLKILVKYFEKDNNQWMIRFGPSFIIPHSHIESSLNDIAEEEIGVNKDAEMFFETIGKDTLNTSSIFAISVSVISLTEDEVKERCTET